MNIKQFISKWSKKGEEEEMLKDLKMVIKDAEEERESWIFQK
jgi:hypothetical protein